MRPFWLILSIVAVILVFEFSQATWEQLFRKEWRGVELASAVSLTLCVPTYFFFVRGSGPRDLWFVPFFLVLLAMREFDMDKAFLEKGVFQARLYTGPAPLLDKIIGATVVGVILYALWCVVRRGLPAWGSALRMKQGWAVTLLIAIAIVVIAKTLDGIDRKLLPFGATFTQQQVYVFASIEECLELVFSVLLALVLCLWAPNRQTG